MSPTEYFDVGFLVEAVLLVDLVAVDLLSADDDLAEVLDFLVAMNAGSVPANDQSTCGVHSWARERTRSK